MPSPFPDPCLLVLEKPSPHQKKAWSQTCSQGSAPRTVALFYGAVEPLELGTVTLERSQPDVRMSSHTQAEPEPRPYAGFQLVTEMSLCHTSLAYPPVIWEWVPREGPFQPH